MTKAPMHPLLLIILLFVGGPLLGLCIGLFVVVCAVGDAVLRALTWPYRIIMGAIFLVLGGGG